MEVQVEVLVGGPVVDGTAVVSRHVLVPVAVQPGEPGLDRVLDGGLSGQQIHQCTSDPSWPDQLFTAAALILEQTQEQHKCFLFTCRDVAGIDALARTAHKQPTLDHLCSKAYSSRM